MNNFSSTSLSAWKGKKKIDCMNERSEQPTRSERKASVVDSKKLSSQASNSSTTPSPKVEKSEIPIVVQADGTTPNVGRQNFKGGPPLRIIEEIMAVGQVSEPIRTQVRGRGTRGRVREVSMEEITNSRNRIGGIPNCYHKQSFMRSNRNYP